MRGAREGGGEREGERARESEGEGEKGEERWRGRVREKRVREYIKLRCEGRRGGERSWMYQLSHIVLFETGHKPYKVTFASDYFSQLYHYAVELIKR